MSRAADLANRPKELLQAFHEATDPDYANAFAAASARGGSYMLEPNRVYPVNSAVTLGDEDASFWSPIPAKAQGGARITTTMSSGTLFTCGGANASFSNVHIAGGVGTAGPDWLIKAERNSASDPADIDIRLDGCLLEGGDTALFVNGRGLQVRNGTTFVDYVTAIDIDHPTSFAAPTAFDNTLYGGARKYIIDAAYFHNGSGRAIRAEGTNGQYVYGLQITNCHSDDRQRFFRGYLNDAVVTGNLTYRGGETSSHAFDCMSVIGSRNSIIGLNNFGGDRYDAMSSDGTYALRRFRRMIYLGGTHNGLKIVDNVLFGAVREAVLIDTGATLTGFDISRNMMRYVCLENDTQTRRPITSSSATLTRGKINDNILEIPAMTNNASAAMIYKTGSTWADVEYHGNSTSGSMPLLSGTGITGGLKMLDQTAWLWTPSTGVGAGIPRIATSYPVDDTSGSAI
jgi:hypothetical protein